MRLKCGRTVDDHFVTIKFNVCQCENVLLLTAWTKVELCFHFLNLNCHSEGNSISVINVTQVSLLLYFANLFIYLLCHRTRSTNTIEQKTHEK